MGSTAGAARKTTTPVDASDRKLYAKAAEKTGNKKILSDFDTKLSRQSRSTQSTTTTSNDAPPRQRITPQRAEDPSDQKFYNKAADRQNKIIDLENRAATLNKSIDALGTSSPHATKAMQAELDRIETELRKQEQPAERSLPTTKTVITVDTPLVFNEQGAIKNAYQTFAEQQGLSPDQARDYAEGAYALTNGQVHTSSTDPDRDGRVITAAELRQQRAEGRLEFSPTRAQLGLLHAMSSQDPGSEIQVTGHLGASAVGSVLPSAANVVPGNHTTATETAVKILEDVADGRPPFRPELGQRGGTQWFVTEGNPHVGTAPEKPVTIPVEITNPSGAQIVEFNESDLLEIFEAERRSTFKTAEAQFRQANRIPDDTPLSNTQLKKIDRRVDRIAQSRMWTRVGEMVAASDSGVGRVNLVNSVFSKSGDGQFMLTSRADAVNVRGGAGTLVDIIKKTGEPADNAVLEAAQRLATQEKWAGRVQGAFKYGGKVLVIVGAAADGYRIYQADNKWQEAAEVAGGWGGATAASAAWAKGASPLLATGPWGWLGYGGGMLVTGAAGYWVGERAGEEVYELVVDGDPILIGPKD